MKALGRHLVTMGLMEVEQSWFEVFISHLRAFKAEHGHCKVPLDHICSDGYKLGQTVSGIRSGNRKSTTDEQRAILDAEGFIWNASLYGLWWPEFIEHLRAFKVENGHCRVPKSYVCSDGYKLGHKIADIRSRGNRPTEEQQAILNAEGFIWQTRRSPKGR